MFPRTEAPEGLCANTVAVVATGSWTIYRWGWRISGSDRHDEAYVPFFGASGAAWDDAMVARWSANPTGMIWGEMDAELLAADVDGGDPMTARRPVVVIAAG